METGLVNGGRLLRHIHKGEVIPKDGNHHLERLLYSPCTFNYLSERIFHEWPFVSTTMLPFKSVR